MQRESNIRLRELIHKLRAISRSGKSFSVIWDEYQAQIIHAVQSESINMQKELIQASERGISLRERCSSPIQDEDLADWHNPGT